MLGGKRGQKSSMWDFFDKLRGEDVVPPLFSLLRRRKCTNISLRSAADGGQVDEILFSTKKCKFSVDKLAHANYNIDVVRKG